MACWPASVTRLPPPHCSLRCSRVTHHHHLRIPHPQLHLRGHHFRVLRPGRAGSPEVAGAQALTPGSRGLLQGSCASAAQHTPSHSPSALRTSNPPPVQNTAKGQVAWMFWILILLLLVSRAIFVIPVTLAHNRYNDQKLSMRDMGVIWWAGMMRGAVSGAPPPPLAGARARTGEGLARWSAAVRLLGAAGWSRVAVAQRRSQSPP